MQVLRQLADTRVGSGDGLLGGLDGIDARVQGCELRVRLLRAREQLVVGLRTEPPPRVGDALKACFDLLEAARLCAEGCKEGAQLGRGLAQA